jgi:Arc/MetJ-type ribon-helix-helix transcriptional regulator
MPLPRDTHQVIFKIEREVLQQFRASIDKRYGASSDAANEALKMWLEKKAAEASQKAENDPQLVNVH